MRTLSLCVISIVALIALQASAAPLADAAMTPYHAIRNSLRVLRPGSTALVVGVGGLGHVAGNFNLSDLAWQNEVNYAILGLFVVLEARQNPLRAHVHLRQGSQTKHRIRDTAGGHGVRSSDAERDIRRGYHSPGHGFAVQQRAIIRFRFESVADCVSQVEDAP